MIARRHSRGAFRAVLTPVAEGLASQHKASRGDTGAAVRTDTAKPAAKS